MIAMTTSSSTRVKPRLARLAPLAKCVGRLGDANMIPLYKTSEEWKNLRPSDCVRFPDFSYLIYPNALMRAGLAPKNARNRVSATLYGRSCSRETLATELERPHPGDFSFGMGFSMNRETLELEHKTAKLLRV